MKIITTIMLLLMQCINAHSQQSIIGNTPENVLPIIKEVAGFFKVEMRRGGDPFSRQKIQYIDSTHYYGITILSDVKKEYEGTAMVIKEPQVRQITIQAPQNKITQLYAYFQNKYKSYNGFKTGGQYIHFENVNIYYQADNSSGDIPMATLIFEKRN